MATPEMKTAADLIQSLQSKQIPLSVAWHGLQAKINETENLDEMLAASEAAQAIEDILVDRNLQGIEYEKSGNDIEAIKLYEQNITDLFDGSHPYERLRIIYTSKNRYTDAIRVCQACIDNE
ncbi:MAG: hypothetical protein HGB04_03870 [Chlorobiaceae bacterium]|nr:hypothetical protein [Chlorobiaceae bacterium]